MPKGESLSDYILRTEKLAHEIDKRMKILQAAREECVLKFEAEAHKQIADKIAMVTEAIRPLAVSQNWIDKQSDPDSDVMIELQKKIEALDRQYDAKVSFVVEDVTKNYRS